MKHLFFFSQHGRSVIDSGILGTKNFNPPIKFWVGTQTHYSHMCLEKGSPTQTSTVHKTNREETMHKFIWNPDKISHLKANIGITDFKRSVGRASKMRGRNTDSVFKTSKETLLQNTTGTSMQRTVVLKAFAGHASLPWFDTPGGKLGRLYRETRKLELNSIGRNMCNSKTRIKDCCDKRNLNTIKLHVKLSSAAQNIRPSSGFLVKREYTADSN